uniref:Uncharacterized protein n=1 Tax=Arundo donax TaxID=35708 RepID=A0A0A9EEZ6_ARUDO
MKWRFASGKTEMPRSLSKNFRISLVGIQIEEPRKSKSSASSLLRYLRLEPNPSSRKNSTIYA